MSPEENRAGRPGSLGVAIKEECEKLVGTEQRERGARMIKVFCMIVTYLVQMVFFGCLFSERRPSVQVNQAETIARVKHLDVSKLDPGLKKQEFGRGWAVSLALNQKSCGRSTTAVNRPEDSKMLIETYQPAYKPRPR